MNNTKISVVTISFNQARYIRETINSVLEQNYDNYEYIIVDAGSTDGSRDIILEYKDKIKEIIFEEDDGPSDGLNKGFDHATGEIFCFLNSDDVLLPDAFETVVEYFSKTNADVVCGNGYQIDENGIIRKLIVTDKLSFYYLLYNSVTFIQPALFFKSKCFIDANRFNVENKTCWDYELLLKMASNGSKIINIPEFISCFRLHNDSISGTGKLNNLYLNDLNRIYKDITDRNIGFSYKVKKYLLKIYKSLINPKKLKLLLNKDLNNTKVKIKFNNEN